MRWRVISGGAGSNGFRFLDGAVQLANDTRPNLPRREFQRLRVLAFADLAIVTAAYEQARYEYLIAPPKSRRRIAQAIEADHAMPIGLRLPLALRVLPQTLCRNGQQGEWRAVGPRLPLLWVAPQVADDLD